MIYIQVCIPKLRTEKKMVQGNTKKTEKLRTKWLEYFKNLSIKELPSLLLKVRALIFWPTALILIFAK